MAVEMPGFEVPQFYETTIMMRHRSEKPDREFQFLCVPAAAIHEDSRDLLDDPQALLSELGLTESTPLGVAQLPDAIFTLLRAEDLGDDAGSVLGRVTDAAWLANGREADPDAALFAEYLAFAEVVPLEQSKVTGYALSTLAMTSYGAAKGITTTAQHAAPVFGPHAPVVYAVALGTAGGVAVIDSVGVIIGFVTSPRTREGLRRVRNGIKRLIRRPHSAKKDRSRNSSSEPPAPGIAEEKKQMSPEERAKRIASLQAKARKLPKPKHKPAEQ
jgi:hypothetical protein